jgi:hypothetical protein
MSRNEIDAMDLLMRAMKGEDPSDIIRDHEKQGQELLIQGQSRLPRRMRGDCDQAGYEKMGIVFEAIADDLFWWVTLPIGWEIARTDHSMWTHLLDNKGRKRAAIFYKVAFYDRDAFIDAYTRYTTHREPACGWDGENWQNDPYVSVVRDCGVEIWRSDVIDPDLERWKASEIAGKLALEWLQEHYPDHNDIHAYWD